MAASCYPTAAAVAGAGVYDQPQQKDYSRPLHVDCSVEYELPNAAKPPQGVRNEPLLMIHPCYFRKIESQRRSPFVNNLPAAATAAVAAAAAATVTAKRRTVHRPQQQAVVKNVPVPVPQPPIPQPVAAAQYPAYAERWEPAPAQPCCKREPLVAATCSAYSARWPDPDGGGASPDRHILSGKYRQYLRAHRLHPYVAAFPQIQQVCYNV